MRRYWNKFKQSFSDLPLTKNKKARKLVLLSFAVLFCLIAANVLFTYYSAVNTTSITVANHGVEMAKSVASSIDTKAYKQFLAEPGYTDSYWEFRSQLSDARQKIGALYVYTLKIENQTISKGMIMGLPKDITGFDIGTICTVPPNQVALAYEGKTFYTDVLQDPEHGKYLTVGAPILDEYKNAIGYIGIDLSVEMLDEIRGNVIRNSFLSFLYSVLFVIVLIIAYSLIHWRYQRIVKESIAETEKTYLKEMKSFLTTMRSLRHDYFNHFHIINGLLEHKQFDQAHDYIRTLTKDIKLTELLPQIDHPALLVLLQTKWETALQHHIDFNIEVMEKASFEHIQPTDLIKILSNLIDNAIESTILLPKEDRMIKITCRIVRNYYYFEIANSGDAISDQDKTRIFQEGYSTKKEQASGNRGYGLSIVLDAIKRYKGEIAIESKNQQTSFRVMLPIPNSNGETHAIY